MPPSIPAIGDNDERRGESETGQHRPSVVRFSTVKGYKDQLSSSENSVQEALRMYLQPIKSDDPQPDFYIMYERETVEYDTEYMQKHNEDLNTTLIFVRVWIPLVVTCVDHNFRPVCSPRSALPSSSTSSPSSSQTLANGRKHTSERSSSASTDPFFPTRIPPLLQRGAELPRNHHSR